MQFDFSEFIKDNRHFRVIVLGATGSGKSVFCRKFCSAYLTIRKHHIFIHDVKDEFEDIPELSIESLVDVNSAMRRVRKLRVKKKEVNDARECNEFLSAIAWEFAPDMLYCEEFVEVAQKHDSLPTSHPVLYKCLQQGRSQEVSMLFSTQMISQLNLQVFRQRTILVLFAMTSKECRELEKLLALEKNSLDFQLPEKVKSEYTEDEMLDLYTFYTVDNLGRITKYDRIPYRIKPLGRPKKIKQEEQDGIIDVEVKTNEKTNSKSEAAITEN